MPGWVSRTRRPVGLAARVEGRRWRGGERVDAWDLPTRVGQLEGDRCIRQRVEWLQGERSHEATDPVCPKGGDRRRTLARTGSDLVASCADGRTRALPYDDRAPLY